MFYIILGQTGSGKSTLLKNMNQDFYSKPKNITTRPRRENETDYEFVSEEEYDSLSKSNKLICEYEAKNGWKYGIKLEELEKDLPSVLILEPSGYYELIEKYGREKVIGIYLDIPIEERIERLLKRDSDYKETLRRIGSDLVDFRGIHYEVDTIITIQDLDILTQKVENIIRSGIYYDFI